MACGMLGCSPVLLGFRKLLANPCLSKPRLAARPIAETTGHQEHDKYLPLYMPQVRWNYSSLDRSIAGLANKYKEDMRRCSWQALWLMDGEMPACYLRPPTLCLRAAELRIRRAIRIDFKVTSDCICLRAKVDRPLDAVHNCSGFTNRVL